MIAAAVPASAVEVLRAAVPEDVEVRALPSGGADPAVLAGVSFLLLGWGSEPLLDVLPSLRDLRVVQTVSAGTDWLEDRVPRWATLCNARGARDIPVAEWVVGALLSAQAELLSAARVRRWRDVEPRELHGSTVLVLGFGSIGEAVRERLAPFGVEVVAVGRSHLDALPLLLPRAHALVVLAPLTPESRGMVDAGVLARLPDGALVVNAGRGAVIDTRALVDETSSGRLRAVLDVVDPEPLPGDHPLWHAPGVLAITPHHAGDTEAADRRAVELAAEQLARYARGEELRNVVLAAGR